MEKQEQMTPEQRIKRLEQEIAILKKIAELALLLGVNLDTNSSGRFTEQQHYTAEVALNEILEIDPEKTRRIREFRPVYNRSYEPLPKGTDKTIEALLKSFGFEYPEINASQSSSTPMPQKAQQGSEQLSNGDLAFIISIANLNQPLMGYKILQGCLKSRITQKAVYFARVALCRVYNEVETENRVRTIAYGVVKSSFADDVAEELFAEWNKELENKTVIEIIQIIRQTILKVPTLQDQNPGPQR